MELKGMCNWNNRCIIRHYYNAINKKKNLSQFVLRVFSKSTFQPKKAFSMYLLLYIRMIVHFNKKRKRKRKIAKTIEIILTCKLSALILLKFNVQNLLYQNKKMDGVMHILNTVNIMDNFEATRDVHVTFQYKRNIYTKKISASASYKNLLIGIISQTLNIFLSTSKHVSLYTNQLVLLFFVITYNESYYPIYFYCTSTWLL